MYKLANIIDAIESIVNAKSYELTRRNLKGNDINRKGSSLENFIIDCFAKTLNNSDPSERDRKINEVFSYTGSANNPPDAIVKNGIAIEVKKLYNLNSVLQLNSSYPEAEIYRTDSKLIEDVKNDESWSIKEQLYAIGVVDKDTHVLKNLALIDGKVFLPERKIYEELLDKLKKRINSMDGIKFSKTNEIGRVNEVDPLGTTSLRIRPMWLLKNPFVFFKDIYSVQENANFNLFCLVSQDHYRSFKNISKLEMLMKENKNLSVENVLVNDPNGKKEKLECKKIVFFKGCQNVVKI